jgi:hypothetical protein
MSPLVAVAAAFLGAAPAADAPARPYAAILEEAQAAFAAADYAVAAARLDEAQALRPYSLFLTRNRMLARYLAGDKAGAIAIASGVAARGLALDLPVTDEFDRLRADPAFAPVAARFDANRRPVGESRIVAEFAETGFLPEAIAKQGGRILIGSVRTGGIYETGGGALKEIARLDGGVFDIEADEASPNIFAVINNQLAYEKAGDRPPEAAVVEVDLRSGEVLWKQPIEGGAALLGDLEQMPGRLYSSDSLKPRVFEQDPDLIPRPLAEDSRFANVQGIALDAKKRRLFVADYLTGLFVVDATTKEVRAIENRADAHLGGIDGLYLYKGDLIGIQNGTSPQRIVRIDLDKKGVTARKLTVLQQALPEWNEPTHGFIDGDRFIYIATSNWPAYGDDGKPVEGARLEPLRLMAVDLD